MFSLNLNDYIASTHHFRIVFILFSLETVFKNALDEFKRLCFEVTAEISSSLNLMSMLCCQVGLKFLLKLADSDKFNRQS